MNSNYFNSSLSVYWVKEKRYQNNFGFFCSFWDYLLTKRILVVVLRILRIEIARIVSNGHLTAQPEQLSKRGKPGSCVNLATWGEFVTWQTKAVSLSNHHNNNKMPYIPSTFWGFFNLGELCDSNLLERISFNPFNTICKGGKQNTSRIM